MEIKQAQQQVDEWIKTIGVRYFSELTNLGILMEEVGELSRLMVRRYGDQNLKPGETAAEISDELADILWVLLALANQTGTDLQKAFLENMQKKTLRDKVRHRNNPKLG